MKHFRIPLAALLALFLLLALIPAPAVRATEAQAQDIRSSTTVSGTGYSSFAFLFDGNTTSYKNSDTNASITLANDAGMAALYLLFDSSYGRYTIRDEVTGAEFTAGTNGFLHECIDLTAAFGYSPTRVTLAFSGGSVRLSEIYVFSEGQLPDYVQQWSAPLEGKADLVLFATHGDDDQLFFAGLLPLYAGQLGLNVQVVYLTDHRSGYTDNARMHEMINGLWAVGVTAYPVWGEFADFRIDSLQGTYDQYAAYYNTTREDLLSFVVEQIRRFKPLVAVGHDVNGEYGHGMHKVYTDLLISALELTGNAEAFPTSAEAYGTWQIQKLYLHLYEDNPIVLDYDQPLSAFDGMTAFQVTQKLGFPCHKSQQWTWFSTWLNGSNGEITKAAQISTYNPCHFGLYYSAVGPDVLKNDFMENITTYSQQAQADNAAADAVAAMIDALGAVTLDSGDAIAAARQAYNSLTETQKQLVANAPALADAEAAYDALVQEKQAQEAADAAAAQAVIDLIDAIGTYLDEPSLDRIRAEYDALTDAQKSLVTNYDQLLEAEALQQEILTREEQARLEQEQLAQEQAELKKLMMLVGVLAGLLVITLLILRHKRKHSRHRRRR